jgi:hypothetical protein
MRFSLVIENVAVDLFNDESIQLVRQIKDYQDLSNSKTDFTQQFVIPSTSINDPIFQNYFDENAVFSGWNAFIKLDAQIFIHSLPVFTGCVELTGVEFKNGLPRQYNLVFYGQGKNAMSQWGEKTLQEIDWSDYNHEVTYANVISSWGGGLVGGSILYPIVDWYKGMQYCRTPTVQNNMYGGGTALNGGFLVNDLRPAVLLKDMITTCFDSIGYTLSGSLLDRDEFDELYVAPMGTSGPIQNSSNQDAKFKVTTASRVYAPTNNWIGYVKMTFDTVVSNPSGYWNVPQNIYITYLQGKYTFRFSCDVTVNTGNVGFSLINAGNWIQYNRFTSGTGSFSADYIVELNTNVTVAMAISAPVGCTIANVVFELIEVPYAIEGTTLNIVDTMPQMKVSDFMNGILKTFNGVLIPKSETEFELHNIDDYYALGSTKDWTKYIDVENIRHEKMSIPRQIEMKHKEGEDQGSLNFVSNFNRLFGEIKASPDVDFANDELMIETPFNVLVPGIIKEKNDKGQYVGNTNLQIPVMLDNDNKQVKHDLLLFYYVGQTNTTYTYDLNQTTQFAYPLISSYSEFPTTENSYSLAFGLETTIQGDMATKTMFTQYWQKYLSRLFSSRSRVVYFSAILPVGEWLNLQMNDTIAVSGNYYKIQQIEYDMLNERASLQLISYPDVDILRIASDGITPSWENATGGPSGTTLLNGDIVGRAITNAIPLVGGGLSTGTLGKVEYLDSNTNWHQGSLNELVKRKRIKTGQGLDQTVTIPTSETYFVVPLTTEYQTGDTQDLVFSTATDSITPLYGGQFKITAELSYEHGQSHDLTFAIMVGGEPTFSIAVLTSNKGNATLNGYFDIPLSAPIQMAIKKSSGSTHTIDIAVATLMVEHI